MRSDTTLIQVTRIRYKQIAEELRTQISAGELAAGQVLPSEAALGDRFGASRVTVRKALELLRAEGKVESRQGFGWSVSADTVAQGLSGLVTIEQQLQATGRRSRRQILDFRFVKASRAVAQELGKTVLEVRRLNFADDQPFARVTVWCREDLAAGWSRDEVQQHSILELVSGEALGATQTIGALAVTESDAELLGVPSGSPGLVVHRVTHDAHRRALLVSEHVFPAHLTEFAVELPMLQGEAGSSPPGVRLRE